MENKQDKNEMEVRLPLGDESKLATAGLARGAITRGEITQPGGGGSSSQEDQQEPQKYPLSPFSLNRDETEHIGLGSGNLNLTVTDFVLPGKNGFDLKLTRTYNSMMANVTDLTIKFESVERYTWSLKFKFKGEDDRTGEMDTYSVSAKDPTVGYASEQDASAAAEEWIRENNFRESNVVEVEVNGRRREVVVRSALKDKEINTSRKTSSIPVSDLRPNDHLTDTYRLGLGWGFGFPSIESVKEAVKKNRVKYYYYFHSGDGGVYPFKPDELFSTRKAMALKGHELGDFTLYQEAARTFSVEYKDGRKAYFNGTQLSSMVDRFGNRISFDFQDSGMTITDTMGRKLTLQKGNITDGYTLTWTLPDKSTIVYTVKTTTKAGQTFPVLASVKDQAGRVTSYTYANYPTNLGNEYKKGYLHKSIYSNTDLDAGVDIYYHPLTDVTYPTGAKSRYVYEFLDGRDRYAPEGSNATGIDGMLLLRQRMDYESSQQKNLELYQYGVTFDTDQNEVPLYISSATMTAGERTDKYFFEVYSAPATRQETFLSGSQTKLYERIIDKADLFRKSLPQKQTEKWYQGGNVLTRVNQWDYEPTGDVKSETRPLAGTTTITYDPTYYLMTAKEYKKDGNTTIREEYTLSADKKQVTMKKVFEKSGSGAFALKEATQYQYDGNHNLTLERQYLNLSLTASAGDRVTRYSYHSNGVYLAKKWVTGLKDAWGAAQKDVSESYEYDACGRVTVKIDGEGRQTRYQYDGLGRVVQETRPSGYQRRTGYLDAQNRLIETDELGHQKRYDYTPLGKIAAVYTLSPDVLQASYAYDNRDRLITESAYSTAGTATTSYRYDHYDRVLEKKITGPGLPEYKEIYSYHDAYQNAYSMESKTVAGAGASSPDVTSVTLRDVLGRVVEEKTGSSAVRYGYDFLDNKIWQTDPRDGVQTAWWSYDWAGRVLTETRQEPSKKVVARTVYDALGQKKSFTDFRGNPTGYTYDLAGRLLEQVAKLSDGMNAVTRYSYDAAGNVTRQDVLAAGGKYRTTRYTYDAENRVVDTIVNDGQTETRTRNVYDAIGNKLAVYTGMLGGSLSGAAKTSYTYDKLGNVLSMTDPMGNAPNPQQKERRTEWYRYDQYGKIIGKTDRNGYVTEYRYDVLGRVLSETVRDPDGREPALVQSFSYYKNGQKQSEENGELRSVFTYDNRGSLASQTETCKRGKVNLVVKSYAYDGSGNRQSFTLSKDGVQQLELGYGYDRQNRLSEVKRGGQVIAAYQYDDNGNRASLSHPQSGLATTYAYNAGNLVTSLVNKSGNVVRSSFSYEYAPDGNQVKKVSQVAGKQKVTSYVYDLLGRLTEEKVAGGETVSYAYDRFSNRRTMTVTKADGKAVMSSYEYDLRNRLLKEIKKDKTSEETYVYRYDFNGNQLQRLWEKFETGKGRTEPGRVSFAKKRAGEVVICERRGYNGLNQLTSLYQDGEVTRYRYRPDGLRLCKEKADGTETGHIWDGSEMVAEYQANGNIIARYLRGINLIARELDGQQEYYLHNAHGDVVQRTDRYGTPLKSYDYDAFGNEEKPEELDHNPWRYCGEYLDLEVQNYYLRARSYEPRTGRFTQQDSVAYTTAKLPNGTEAVDPLSLNLYTYCGNNPVMFTDPSGNFAIVDDLAYLGVGIGLIALAGIVAVSTLSSTGSLRSAWDQGVSNFLNNLEAMRETAQELYEKAQVVIENVKVIVEIGLEEIIEFAKNKNSVDPYARPGQKKQGRERKEKKKRKDWDSRSNKPINPPKKHTPGRGHRRKSKPND
ncbi:RHS repeat-associated core domain-containing protein [Harryflintia acetispora]|uniref:RHS repeat-associated core domain-containing protein n=1 Tax=Harryflintia acetispora TaxID=1849041 RepID=UPI00189B0825|nr:RHS repeat-associated core domain-containing protein [Harryflintia acetispora]